VLLLGSIIISKCKNCNLCRKRYIHLAVPGGDNNEKRRDRLMFLWIIINRTTAMTTATLSVLIDQIFNLKTLMQETNNDVQAFNTKVQKFQNAYYANKHEQFDEMVLLNSMAKAYQQCND
jgi:hypothetical protein